ncbi:hypothetical protein BDW59DRAFT_164130 [Aspergillus cavernicola]|uniref:Uncharacterized protein n=1 Tax=Aspergillus cavernicola TaxID=176166 RepID=A0ABR4I0W9_9EURO
MNPSTSSALRDISSLSSPAKTALMDTIAQEMTTIIITISKEIQRGTLKAQHTAPFNLFIRTIQRDETAQQRKLERKLARYQRRGRRWRAERQWIRRDLAGMVRQMEILHGRWKKRVEVLEKKGSVTVASVSRSDSGSGSLGGESSSG